MGTKYIIVESASASRLLAEHCIANDREGLEQLYRHLREDTRLIANSFRSCGFIIVNCAGINVTAYSADPLAQDDTLVDGVRSLTRPRLDFRVGLGTTLAQALEALHQQIDTERP